MSSKNGITLSNTPSSTNTNQGLFTIEADDYSEEESSQKINDEDDDDSDYSTTTDSRPPISKVPIFISSPKIPDDVILPNVPTHVCYTESETTNSNVSAVCLDQSSLETSHISSINVESTYDTSKDKKQSLTETINYKNISSSSSSISIQIENPKQQAPTKQQNNFLVKKEQNAKQQNPKEQITKQQDQKEQNIKQQNSKYSNAKQKQIKQSNFKSQKSSSNSNSPSNQMIVNLPSSRDKKNRKNEPSEDESVEIDSSNDTMTCQSGTFSEYSRTTSFSSTTNEYSTTYSSNDSSLFENQTIKTYKSDDLKTPRAIQPEPPTVCCMLV